MPRYGDQVHRRVCLALLFAVTACWGISFTVIHDAVSTVSPYAFVAVRFFFSAALLLVCAPRRIFRSITRATIRDGSVLGFFLGAGYLLQTAGIAQTTPSVAGFLTGLCVVFIPLLLHLGGRSLPAVAWIAVAVAACGLGVLTLNGGRIDVTVGTATLLACAVAYAVQVVLTTKFSERHDLWALTWIEIVTVTILSFAVVVIRSVLEHQTVANPMTGMGQVWLALAFTAVVCTVVAYLVMNAAQRVLSAWEAGLVFASEPVFAAGYSMATGAEPLRMRTLAGGTLILFAMVLTEWSQREKADAV